MKHIDVLRWERGRSRTFLRGHLVHYLKVSRVRRVFVNGGEVNTRGRAQLWKCREGLSNVLPPALKRFFRLFYPCGSIAAAPQNVAEAFVIRRRSFPGLLNDLERGLLGLAPGLSVDPPRRRCWPCPPATHHRPALPGTKVSALPAGWRRIGERRMAAQGWSGTHDACRRGFGEP